MNKIRKFFRRILFRVLFIDQSIKKLLETHQNKSFEEKITISLQRVIASLKKIISLKTLKNKVLSMNIRLNNIRINQIFENNDKNKNRIVKLYKTLNYLKRFIFNIAQEFFFVEK